jgi:hypothetical protein
MTVNKILTGYLKQNGFDGLHSHHENNNYGGCCCGIKKLQSCGEYCQDCEPGYAHKLTECKKCPDFEKCEPNQKINYCGRKKNAPAK